MSERHKADGQKADGHKADDREAEGRRVLSRIKAEMQTSGVGVSNHDQDDPIERLGRRIARVLSVIITLGMALWIIGHVFGQDFFGRGG
jgi:hypothetical protein